MKPFIRYFYCFTTDLGKNDNDNVIYIENGTL